MKWNPNETVETPDGVKAASLNPVEVEVIHLFVQLSRALGQPPLVAEIYGLLFISPNPLPQDEFTERLNLSKGSAIQHFREVTLPVDQKNEVTSLQAKVRCVRFKGDNEVEFLDLKVIEGDIIQQVEDAMAFVRRNTSMAAKIEESLERKER